MRIYLSYSQFKAIRKSVIISDFILIIFTAIAFYASFFVELKHFFIFAGACFLVKWFANLSVKKQFRFPSTIHLIAPFPIFLYLLLSIFWFIFYIPFFGIILSFISLCIIFSIIVLYLLIESICLKFVEYKVSYYYKILPFCRLYNYYNLMGGFIGKDMNMVCFIFQISCFYSIAFSIFYLSIQATITQCKTLYFLVYLLH